MTRATDHIDHEIPELARHLPQCRGERLVTDGGLETDLIFHAGLDLPHFASFPLLDDAEGRGHLTAYYDGYAAIAEVAGAGLMLETPTWRANTDWGAEVGYDQAALDRVNADAIAFVAALRDRYRTESPAVGEIVLSGQLGPKGDGYQPAEAADTAAFADYHRPQLAAFKAAGADLATALTLTTPGEALGIAQAAADVGLPVATWFTVETDGRLPDGTPLADAIDAVDAAGSPAYFGVNCAHPEHLAGAFPDAAGEPQRWARRILGMRYNASTCSHAELDEAEELDEGDLGVLGAGHAQVSAAFPWLTILGGCCGTDSRHVASLWGQKASLA
ncbi:MAG: homocysteine S-methyltransferase family protein [Solirubrobacteraceae bacterium]|nr:homocysteine S-methyltransferase family protein [Solirubrobacteraceae bacterium]